MITREKLAFAGIGALFFILLSEAGCPNDLPIEIEGSGCYRFEKSFKNLGGARDKCRKLDPPGKVASIKSSDVLKKLAEVASKHVEPKYKDSRFWIGFNMKDNGFGKKVPDREWTWAYDGSKIVQKDYALWDEEGGPTNKDFTCGTLSVKKNYAVEAIKCNGAELPLICMMKKGEKCKHNMFPYLTYKDYCVFTAITPTDEKRANAFCDPNKLTPYQEDMKYDIKLSIKNAHLAGGMYTNYVRYGDKFADSEDGSVVEESMWEEGEPRDQYDCVVMSLQPDDSLKLKTFNCEFYATSICQLAG